MKYLIVLFLLVASNSALALEICGIDPDLNVIAQSCHGQSERCMERIPENVSRFAELSLNTGTAYDAKTGKPIGSLKKKWEVLGSCRGIALNIPFGIQQVFFNSNDPSILNLIGNQDLFSSDYGNSIQIRFTDSEHAKAFAGGINGSLLTTIGVVTGFTDDQGHIPSSAIRIISTLK